MKKPEWATRAIIQALGVIVVVIIQAQTAVLLGPAMAQTAALTMPTTVAIVEINKGLQNHSWKLYRQPK